MGDTYNEPGYTAVDICDGDVTDKVSVSGNVDTANAGKYTVTYNVSDNCGNESEVQRTVKVVAPMSDDAVNPGDKVVYLTFDDGPGPYTEKLLDILDRYNVKATFFVTNGNRIIRILLHKKHSGDILLQYIQHHMIMQRYIRV
ncbi:MAG: immunoglobulin-like domain-containing protein [Lachnospira eligens]